MHCSGLNRFAATANNINLTTKTQFTKQTPPATYQKPLHITKAKHDFTAFPSAAPALGASTARSRCTLHHLPASKQATYLIAITSRTLIAKRGVCA
jgi:hypothetical protein